MAKEKINARARSFRKQQQRSEDSQRKETSSFIFIFYLFFFFVAVLVLRCCGQAFSSCGEHELLFTAVGRLLAAVASLVAEHGLQ